MSTYAGKRSNINDLGPTAVQASAAAPGKQTLVEQAYATMVQRRANGGGAGDTSAIHAAAAQGVATSSSSLPHGDTIQRLFGRHDISAVQAHTGPDAAASAQAMGAQAYAAGNHVVLGGGGTDLHTVAHEAAHVVQQRGGVQLKGGVGEVGDSYERHADAVADQVVQGKSAEALLDQVHAGPGQAAPAGGVQRVETRGTETGILNEMAGGSGSLTDANSAALIAKMDKDQTNARARAIAAEIEAESEQLVAALPPPDQTAVREAIRNYVASSTAIQNDARDATSGPSVAVQALDDALRAIRQQITATAASNDRIVYRSISYDSSAEIPYGQATAAGDIVNVGDLVGDLGFVSTSAHRQFVSGKEQTAQVQGLLKLAIHGKSGAPIAIHFPAISYTNANQKALYDMLQVRKTDLAKAFGKAFGPGPGAGQAEVLFPRNSVFCVKQIQRADSNVSVVLEEAVGALAGPLKNMKTGTAM